MMDSILFNSKVLNVEQSFTNQDIAELKEITEKYPYFQMAAMLYSKVLLKTNNPDYKKVLAKTATLVNNREQLFNYLYSDLYTSQTTTTSVKPEIKGIVKLMKKSVDQLDTERITKVESKPIANTEVKTETTVKTKVKIEVKPSLDIILKPKAKPVLEKEITERLSPKPITKSEVKPTVDKEIIAKPIIKNTQKATSADFPIIKETEVIDSEPTKEEKSISSITNIKSTPEIQLPKPIIKKGEEIKNKKDLIQVVMNNIALRQAQKPASGKEEHSIKSQKSVQGEETVKNIKPTKAEAIGVLEIVKAKKIKIIKSSKVKPAVTKKKTATKIKVTTKVTKAVDKVNVKTKDRSKFEAIKPVNRKTSIAIVEKFIQEDPSINKPEDKAYIEELAIAKSSLAEDYSIVSETIAKLYKAQGNIKTAKKVYEKLILIYPEKSTYFASLISELK